MWKFKAENPTSSLSACPKKANFSTTNSKLFSHPPATLLMAVCTPAGCWQEFHPRLVSGTGVPHSESAGRSSIQPMGFGQMVSCKASDRLPCLFSKG